MIVREWHCWTTPENAEEHEQLVRGTVLPDIKARGIAGLQTVELQRRDGEGDVEFKFEMWFDSLDSVRDFAGEDYSQPRIPDEARPLLLRYRDRARIYAVRERNSY